MTNTNNLGGSFTCADTSLTVNRMGYGAMQLPGSQVWDLRAIPGKPSESYRGAIEAGVNPVA